MLWRFVNPEMLFGFLPILLLGLFMLWKRYQTPQHFSFRRFFLSLSALSLCVLGLARPQGGSEITTQRGRSSNLFIAMDVSKSMLAEDTLPSRIQFAVSFTQKLLQEFTGIRAAIFPFTLDGYMQLPLTNDLFAVQEMLLQLEPSILSMQGTNLTESLNTLYTRIINAETMTTEHGGEWAGAQVLLLSDGETHVPLEEKSLQKFKSKNIPIFTIGVGTQTGAMVSIQSKENSMERPFQVRTLLQPQSLKRIAELTGGDYTLGQMTNIGLVASKLKRTMALGRLSTSFQVERELFPVLFALAFLLFFIDFFDRKWEYAIRSLLIFYCFSSSACFADVPADLERTAIKEYNAALEALKNKQYEKAVEGFNESAYGTVNKEVQKKSLYNLGNTYLKMGDPANAIQSYQQALDTMTGDAAIDKETNAHISDNLYLAAKMEEEMKKNKSNQKEGGGKQGQGENDGKDPQGPKQYQAEQLTEAQKQKIFDLIASEERQGMQRVESQKNKNKDQHTDKPW